MENRLSQQGPQAARKPIRVDFRRSRDEVRRWRHARLDYTRLREHQSLQTVLAGKIENVVSERSKILKILADKMNPANISKPRNALAFAWRPTTKIAVEDRPLGHHAKRQAGQTGVGGFQEVRVPRPS